MRHIKLQTNNRFLSIALVCMAALLVSFGAAASYLSQSANAADLSDFNPGNIISDTVMSNKDSMTKAQIQSFLASKASSCTSKGPYSNGSYYIDKLRKTHNGTRAETADGKYWWYIKNGHFVCMAEASFGGQSAADIIYEAAQDYSINPQVLIVLLQKEQGLITDAFPNSQQYNTATGYGCPDTAACDTQYYGLRNQVRLAASLFRTVLDGGWSNYPVGRNYILYNPSASCGGSYVNIENRATSALYRYTPYQPNRAALAAGYGTAPCGAYGNRNFYLFFKDWFGSTTGPQLAIGWLNIPTNIKPGDKINARFWVRNTSSGTLNLGKLKVVVRSENGNDDFNSTANEVILRPGETFSYSDSRVLDNEGNYTFRIGRLYDGKWFDPAFSDLDKDYSLVIDRLVYKDPVIVNSSLPTATHTNEDTTASFTVRNDSSLVSADVGTIKLSVRDPRGRNVDLPPDRSVLLRPGETHTYSTEGLFASPGEYTYWIARHHPSSGWSETYPASNSDSVVRKGTLVVKEQATITSSSFDTASYAGDNTSVSFTIKNFGNTPYYTGSTKIAVRNDSGKSYDFIPGENKTLLPGETYTYSDTQKLPVGTYTAWIANTRRDLNIGWSETFPASETKQIERSHTFTVKDPVVVSSVQTPIGSTTGTPVNVRITLKNLGSTIQEVGSIKFAVRNSSNSNYDFSSSPRLTLAPGEEYIYTTSRTFPSEGTYRYWIANFRDGIGWSSDYPRSGSGSISRGGTFVIR